MPRLSIGLPVYNGENYVRECVDSILNQTFEDFELIISDNASTDSTSEICREYAARDSRVRYYRQPTNLGCARNSNFVFAESRGEYFKWISHDDLHAPTFVARCIEVLDRDPSVVLCCTKHVLIDGQGREIILSEKNGKHCFTDDQGRENPIRPYDPPRRLDSWRPEERFRDLILLTNWQIEIYGLIRREALARTRLHGLYHGTDKRVLAELTLMGRLYTVPEVLFFYRQHPVQAKRYKSSGQSKDLYLTGSAMRWTKIPRINNLEGFLTAARKAPLTRLQRLSCYAAVASWLFRPSRWPSLALETAQNIVTAISSLGAKRQPRESQHQEQAGTF
jgi:glycosyltransferase involved in cell wall biosynthesis